MMYMASGYSLVAVEPDFWSNFVRCRFYIALLVCSMTKDSLKENTFQLSTDKPRTSLLLHQQPLKVPRNLQALLQALI